MKKYVLLAFFTCFAVMGMDRQGESEISALLHTMDCLLKKADEIIGNLDSKAGFYIITNPDRDSINYAMAKAVLEGNTEQWVVAKIWGITSLMQEQLGNINNVPWTEEDLMKYKGLLSMRNRQFSGVCSEPKKSN